MTDLKFRIPESKYEPALTANVRSTRNFERDFGGGYPYPYRTKLKLVNKSASEVTFEANGRSETIPANGVFTFFSADFGFFHAYSLLCASAVSAGDVTVYENGGLSHRD